MKLRSVVAIALLSSAGLAGSAVADILPSTSAGGGELFLVVSNSTDTADFIVGLQVQTGSIFTPQTTTSPQTAPITAGFSSTPTLSLSSAAQTALASFIAAQGGNVLWTVMGAQEATTVSATTQNSGIYFSLMPGAPFKSSVSNAVLANQWSTIDAYANDINGIVINTGVGGDGASGTGSNFYATYANGNASTWFATTANAATSLNKAYNFYAMAISNGTNANLYQANFTLALETNGTTANLVETPTAVPLPAAAWLLGSGLLGLIGVGRRRAARTA